MSPTLRVAVVQTRPRFGEPESNRKRARGLLDRALRRYETPQLIVLPELFASGYVFASHREVGDLAENARTGPTAKALREMARETGATVVGGICERDGPRFYNSAIWVGPRGFGGVYRKVHLFHEETRWFSPGERAWPVFRVHGARVGLLICFDWRFPEAARSLALDGAEVLAHPSNLVQPYCQEAMRTRALENGVFAATANRVGRDVRTRRAMSFTGRSQVVGPAGEILTRMGAASAGVRVVECDLREARDKRVTRYNHLFRDRRPGLYRRLVPSPARAAQGGSRRRR